MAKGLLQYILFLLAKAMLWRAKPLVIGITGSVGKTSTKEAVSVVVQQRFPSRRNRGNWNTSIGVPLTILGIEGAEKNVFLWVVRLFQALKTVLFPVQYPRVLILEMGADRPGDIRYLAGMVKPKIGIVTAIGEIPVHVEFFAGPKSVAREKSYLVEVIPIDGWAILNHDDDTVLDMREQTRAHILTYGLEEGAQVRGTNYEVQAEEGSGASVPSGMTFKIEYEGNIVPVWIRGVFGKQHLYAALAAAAAGLALDMNLVDISEALKQYQPPPGRLRLLEGIKHTWILDDTYNAAPASMRAALETLASFDAPRKIAVLGDMLELGRFTEAAHRAIGEFAVFVDELFTVGSRARFIVHEAMERGLEASRIHQFVKAEEAGKAVQEILQEGDVVLVKGSRAMRMEKVVLELMAHPERAKELLVQ